MTRAGPADDPEAMAEWIYFLHPPRDDFAATMPDEEASWALVGDDPVARAGVARPGVRQFRVGFLRGRD